MADSTQPDATQPTRTRVLVPLDGSSLAEHAIPFARALAGDDGELVFLEVASEKETALAALRDTAGRWSGVLGGEPRYEVAPGDPAETILAVADRLGCRFIAIASHGRGAIKRFAFGSVADRIARASTVPVMIVRPHDPQTKIAPASISRLVVPLDGSPLSTEALPVAQEIAGHLGVPVHLVQAINPSAVMSPTPVGVGAYPAEIYTELEDELETEAKTNLDAASKLLADAGIATSLAVVEGPPVFAIEDSLKEGDVVVMTSHGHSGVRRWLLGSVAEKLVRTGPAPVLLVPASTRTAAPER